MDQVAYTPASSQSHNSPRCIFPQTTGFSADASASAGDPAPFRVDACLLHQISTAFRAIAHAADDVTRLSGADPAFGFVKLGKVGLKVVRPSRTATPKPGIRQKIFEFSDSSRRHLLEVCRESGHKIRSQFCLTYHTDFPLDGREVKADVARFERQVKRCFGQDTPMLWVLEFQKRGAPHIHFFSDIEPNPFNRRTLSILWVKHALGYTQSLDIPTFRFHDHVKNFQGWTMKSGQYLVKEYINKIEQKEVPENFQNVGRFWAATRNMKPDYEIISPMDNPIWDECIKRAIRAASRYQEKVFDSYKALKAQVRRRIAEIQQSMPDLEVTAYIRKQVKDSIMRDGHWKVAKPNWNKKTKFRRKRQSYTIYHGAEIFNRVFTAEFLAVCPF